MEELLRRILIMLEYSEGYISLEEMEDYVLRDRISINPKNHSRQLISILRRRGMILSADIK